MSRANPGSVYLGRMATSRALYRQLVKRALDLLPPVQLSKGSEKLLCFDSMVKLGRALGIGRTAIRADLQRLVNYQWIEVEDDAYLLGRREAGQLYLLADLAAHTALGEACFVSRRVLSGLLPAQEEAPDPTAPAPVRGAGRKWTPDD